MESGGLQSRARGHGREGFCVCLHLERVTEVVALAERLVQDGLAK